MNHGTLLFQSPYRAPIFAQIQFIEQSEHHINNGYNLFTLKTNACSRGMSIIDFIQYSYS